MNSLQEMLAEVGPVMRTMGEARPTGAASLCVCVCVCECVCVCVCVCV